MLDEVPGVLADRGVEGVLLAAAVGVHDAIDDRADGRSLHVGDTLLDGALLERLLQVLREERVVALDLPPGIHLHPTSHDV